MKQLRWWERRTEASPAHSTPSPPHPHLAFNLGGAACRVVGAHGSPGPLPPHRCVFSALSQPPLRPPFPCFHRSCHRRSSAVAGLCLQLSGPFRPPRPLSFSFFLCWKGPLHSRPRCGPHALVSVFCFYTPWVCPAQSLSKCLLTA